MEFTLLKKLNSLGLKAGQISMTLTKDHELSWAKKVLAIATDFSRQRGGLPKDFGLMDFILANIDKIFRGPKAAEEGSVFASILAMRNQPEIAVYAELIQNNAKHATVKLFLQFFEVAHVHHPTLYEPKGRTLSTSRYELKKAIETVSSLLREDLSCAMFSRALATYVASKPSGYLITADMIARFMMMAFVNSKGKADPKTKKDGETELVWNSIDPKIFSIEVKQKQIERSSSQDPTLPIEQQLTTANSRVLMENVNANYKKALKQEKNKISDEVTQNKDPLNPKLTRLIGNMAFGDNNEKKVDTMPKGDIDKELIYLRAKLEAQRAEEETQKSIWRDVLGRSKNVIRNYGELKGEINGFECAADEIMALLDQNCEEWKEVFRIKNTQIDELRKFRFLLAAVLENCGQELSRDINEFEFAHDEDNAKMDQIFGRKHDFDLYEYLSEARRIGDIGTELSKLMSNQDYSPEEELKAKNTIARQNKYAPPAAQTVNQEKKTSHPVRFEDNDQSPDNSNNSLSSKSPPRQDSIENPFDYQPEVSYSRPDSQLLSQTPEEDRARLESKAKAKRTELEHSSSFKASKRSDAAVNEDEKKSHDRESLTSEPRGSTQRKEKSNVRTIGSLLEPRISKPQPTENNILHRPQKLNEAGLPRESMAARTSKIHENSGFGITEENLTFRLSKTSGGSNPNGRKSSFSSTMKVVKY